MNRRASTTVTAEISTGVSAVFLTPDLPVTVAALMVTMLSLGDDVTEPLLAGIVTALGSLIFGEALTLGFDAGWRSSVPSSVERP